MSGSAVWVEVNRQHLLDNIAILKKVLKPKILLMAVVKANAYGHGLAEVVPLISGAVDQFGVNSLSEALIVRRYSKKPVLILGYTPIEKLAEVFRENISQSVFSLDYLKKLSGEAARLKVFAKVHLKIETGTNRLGIDPSELSKVNAKQVKIEGLYSHLANAENPEDEFTLVQIEKFGRSVEVIKGLGLKIEILHIGASAASILFSASRLGMSRIGISLYGLWPSKEVERKCGLKLQPVLEWKTVVAQVKIVRAGETIGYDRTFKVSKDMIIAVLPVGYFEGYPMALSNKGVVLAGCKRASVVGRICMNMMMVDVSEISIKPGDEVVLIGSQGRETISADELANLAGTTNYEMVCSINPLLPRLVV